MIDDLKSYISELDEETQLMMDEYPYRDEAFTAYIMSEIDELINTTEYRIEHCTIQNNGGSVSGEIYGYALNDSNEVLSLIYTIYDPTANQEVKSLVDAEYQKAINRMQGFYKSAIRGMHFDLEDDGKANTPMYEIAKDIYDNQRNITTVRLIVLSNSTINKYEIKNQRISGKAIFPDVWDLKKIYANLHSGLDHAPIDVDFKTEEYERYKIPYIEMESNVFGYKCVVALFPGKLLYQLYEKHNTDLLLNNVRYFLGFKGSKDKNANKGILETLKKESQMFLAYNNGITALASDVESDIQSDKTDVGEGSTGNDFISTGILSAIRDFRIVNGGQTTASIFSAKYKDNTISLTGVYVQVKIIVLTQDIHKVSGRITKYSNSQSKIKYSDFTVSNNFNLAMEELSRSVLVPNKNNEPKYWFFERVRGQYDQEKKQNKTKESLDYFNMKFPKDKRFKKEELAKVWKSWSQEPYDAVKGEGTNYELFITKNEDFKPDENYFRKSIALLIIYRFLMSRPEIKGYGNRKATVVTYAIAYLNYATFGRLDLEKIWKAQDLSDNLKIYLNKLCEAIDQAAQEEADVVGVLSWGKRKTSFRDICRHNLGCDNSMLDAETC